jgi:heme/copper-type cytochrome/quinol oxidase subunit 2
MVGARRFHAGWIAFTIVCIIGAIVAGAMMYIAWDHNPQLRFHEDGVIHWGEWLTIGVSWFAVIAGIPCIIAFGVLVASFFRRSQ